MSRRGRLAGKRVWLKTGASSGGLDIHTPPYAQLIDDVANGDGFTTEIRGVKIQKCDEYGKTDTDYKLQLAQVYVDQERQLVDMVMTERDALQARLERVIEVAYGEPDLSITADSPPPHTKYIDQDRLRAALSEGSTP